jgi:type I site-specific restriction endonuclease
VVDRALHSRQDTGGDHRGGVAEFSTANGLADSALILAGLVVAVIEAKQLMLSPEGVLVQAERYACGLSDGICSWRDMRAPFLYSTSGERFRGDLTA